MEAAAERKRGRTVELNHSTRRQMRLSPDPPLVGWGGVGGVGGGSWILVDFGGSSEGQHGSGGGGKHPN